MDEHGARRNEAPHEENGGNPLARAQTGEDHVARQAKEKIADEEQTGAKAVGGGTDAQVLIHGQRGDTDVRPVDKGKEIQEHNEWHEAAK